MTKDKAKITEDKGAVKSAPSSNDTKKPKIKKVVKAKIKCLKLLIDRRGEGLEKGLYPIGFQHVQRWATEKSMAKGELLAEIITIDKAEFDKKRIG